MIWNSWSDFFAMGGYGLYVWGSVVVMFGCLAVEVLAVRAKSKSVLGQYRSWARSARKEKEGTQ